MTLGQAIERLARRETLAASEAEEVMGEVLRGEGTPVEIGAFLMGLAVCGESTDEILGFARALRGAAEPVPLISGPLLDTCGTGGDGLGTQNVSTGAALLAAAHSARVAKHGNRAVGSLCGSADVLEAMGIRVEVEPAAAAHFIDEARFVFLFAPRYHPAMRHAAPVRRALRVRTVMNLLGPLCNPARATHQLLGLSDRRLLSGFPVILSALGVERALCVSARDGMDELSVSAVTDACLLDRGQVTEIAIAPEDAGLPRHPAGSLRGGSAAENARALESALCGEPGALSDALVLNAGAALWIWGAAKDLREGASMAREAIHDGRARRHLALLRELSREP